MLRAPATIRQHGGEQGVDLGGGPGLQAFQRVHLRLQRVEFGDDAACSGSGGTGIFISSSFGWEIFGIVERHELSLCFRGIESNADQKIGHRAFRGVTSVNRSASDELGAVAPTHNDVAVL